MGRPLSVVIADDEPLARQRLRRLLASHDDVRVVGEAGTGREAVDAIHALQPDVAFLDIRMPEGGGFEVVRSLGPDTAPVVVFATAYGEHAAEAFEVRAFDYLLKPFSRARLDEVVGRIRSHVAPEDEPSPRPRRSERPPPTPRPLVRLGVRMGSRIRLVDVGDVDAFESELNYVRVHVGSDVYLTRATLSALEDKLDPAQFVRVHRSLIVNASQVVEVEPLSSGVYELRVRRGQRWRSGRTYRKRVERALHLRPQL